MLTIKTLILLSIITYIFSNNFINLTELIEDLQTRLSSQQKSKEILEDEISSLKSSMNTLDNHLQEYEAQRIHTERQLNLQNRQLEENKAKNESLTSEIENMENHINALKAKQNDVEAEKKTIEEKIRKKDEDVRSQNEHIRELNLKLDRSKGENESLMRKIGEVDSLGKEKQNVLMGSVESLSNENGNLIVKLNKQQTEMSSHVILCEN